MTKFRKSFTCVLSLAFSLCPKQHHTAFFLYAIRGLPNKWHCILCEYTKAKTYKVDVDNEA